jgi:lipopolysaccharide/colanic/teichoic acid biosynthesis glycosyltransferase
MYRHFVKRVIDILVSISVLIVASPILLITMCFLFIANQGKIFFIQQRPGLNGNPFFIIKFKTMNDRKDNNGNLLPDHVRLTKVGKWVRKTSLDELPQLINVLKGDLSLVGPRPLLMEYIPLYNKEQFRRHEVKPGITGWAQVNGRNQISWEKKFEYDVHYVDHLTFLLDIKIIFLTIIKVFKSEGISSANYATMEKFSGTKLTNN